jgi:RHS repeat-associated protein
VTFIWDGDDLLNERIEGANAARYAVLDGEVLSEERGASRYRFVPDPLGSVRAVLDTSGSIIATRDYWPYGEVAAQSGGMTAIQFVGALGYFTDTTNRVYIRARHYRPDLGRWVTRDPMAPGEDEASPYEYAGGTPFVAVDPSGLAPRVTKCTGGTENAIRLGCDCLSSLGAEILARVNACVRSHTRVYHTPCPDMTAAQMSCLAGFCADHCGAVYCVRRDDPATCLADLCGEHCGFTIPGTREGGCGAVYLCYPAHQTRQCRTFGCGSPTAFSMFHEVIHRCRYDQDDPIWAEDCIDFAARCIYEACVGHGVRLPVDPVTGTACPG